ncbi:hypothetical protein PAAL109150_22180 [Paenibacillus alkaliterrae]
MSVVTKSGTLQQLGAPEPRTALYNGFVQQLRAPGARLVRYTGLYIENKKRPREVSFLLTTSQ